MRLKGNWGEEHADNRRCTIVGRWFDLWRCSDVTERRKRRICPDEWKGDTYVLIRDRVSGYWHPGRKLDSGRFSASRRHSGYNGRIQRSRRLGHRHSDWHDIGSGEGYQGRLSPKSEQGYQAGYGRRNRKSHQPLSVGVECPIEAEGNEDGIGTQVGGEREL